MKKKLIEEQIEQELELEMVDSKDGEVTFKVVEVVSILLGSILLPEGFTPVPDTV